MFLHATRTVLVGLVCAGALALAGCGGSSNPLIPSTTPRGEFSQTDLRLGTGADAVMGRFLTVVYNGWLYDPTKSESKGLLFDSSVGRFPPFQFTLGIGAVIRGWDQGIVGMKVGGLRRLVIPPELAYGASGASNGTIPPNATLVFEIELDNVQ